MRGRYDEIGARGAELIAIGTGDSRYAQAFVEEESIPYPVLVDDRGEAARAAAVRVASWFELLHPRTWAATRETRKRGYRIHRAGRRVKQLGGTFVIAPGPRLLYGHVDADSTDHAPLERVLGVLPAR